MALTDGSPASRLATLQARTLLVAAAAFVCLKTAAGSVIDLLTGAGGLPLHVPAHVADLNAYGQLHSAGLAFILLSVAAFSVKPMPPLMARAALGFALFMAAMIALTTETATRPLGLLPSRLEWHALRGQTDEVRLALPASSLSRIEQTYVRAQLTGPAGAAPGADARAVVALYARASANTDRTPVPSHKRTLAPALIPEIRTALSTDPEAAVARYGAEDVNLADPYRQYGNPLPAPAPAPDDAGALRDAAGFDPGVMRALGAALEGRVPPGQAGAGLVRLLAALAMTGASAALLALWYRMAARARRLAILLAYGLA